MFLFEKQKQNVFLKLQYVLRKQPLILIPRKNKCLYTKLFIFGEIPPPSKEVVVVFYEKDHEQSILTV